MATVLCVVGARPNFVKTAPVQRALEDRGIAAPLLHTGQHYDRVLSDSVMEQLGLPAPTYHLGVGSGSHATMTAAVMVGVEKVLLDDDVDAILVPGDVNSTLGAGLAAAKLGVPVIHLEAGLRSRDWTMPEEINRVLVDRLSDLLLVHCEEAIANLAAEGADPDRIAFVGNTMIDSLFTLLPAARETHVTDRLGLAPQGFVLVTLHRPALVDDPARLGDVLAVLRDVAGEIPVVFPVHPRTRARLEAAGIDLTGLLALPPIEYLEFACLQADARLVVTDSGGVQEETSALGVPCLTYRTTTERPVTITHGTNRLVELDPELLRTACDAALAAPMPAAAPRIPLWDGHAGGRAADAIAELLGDRPDAPATRVSASGR